MAIGALRALREAGRDVSGDVSLVGGRGGGAEAEWRRDEAWREPVVQKAPEAERTEPERVS